jgi:hypothetical protein
MPGKPGLRAHRQLRLRLAQISLKCVHRRVDRGREGVTLPALRTVRAVFPHTALQSVVSSSGVSRVLPGFVKCEQPGIGEEGVGP